MSSYLVLARKYRPKTFDEVIGQEVVTRVLCGALEEGRIGHAYLFAGPRGTGKTTTARVFAKCLNCEQGPTPRPCGTCERCVAAEEGSEVDIIEIDAASHTGVDNVRDLRDEAIYAPMRARTKVYIVDEVHMLSKAAFNALLKILEEPPAHVVFLFATTEPHKVLDTILSRCQVLRLSPLSEDQIAQRLLVELLASPALDVVANRRRQRPGHRFAELEEAHRLAVIVVRELGIDDLAELDDAPALHAQLDRLLAGLDVPVHEEAVRVVRGDEALHDHAVVEHVGIHLQHAPAGLELLGQMPQCDHVALVVVRVVDEIDLDPARAARDLRGDRLGAVAHAD